jgi:hypothetical protein
LNLLSPALHQRNPGGLVLRQVNGNVGFVQIRWRRAIGEGIIELVQFLQVVAALVHYRHADVCNHSLDASQEVGDAWRRGIFDAKDQLFLHVLKIRKAL